MFKKEYSITKQVEIDDIEKLERKFGKIQKLSRNENIFGPSPKIYNAAKKMENELFYLYPDLEYRKLDDALAKLNKISADELYVSSGSDDFIYYLTSAICKKNDEVLIFENTFRSYFDAINQAGAKAISIKENNFKYNLSDFLKLVNAKTKIVVIVNPNMPTGVLIDEEKIISFLESLPEDVYVILDHAYFEYFNFGKENLKKYIDRFKNVFILKTFSKFYGLAGLRMGYVVSDSNNINLIKTNIRRLAISNLSQKLSVYALSDRKYYKTIFEKNQKNREWFQCELEKLGINFPKSVANFVYIPLESKEQKEKIVKRILEEKRILIRKYSSVNAIRVTIGPLKEMKKIVSILKEEIPRTKK